MNKNYCFNLTSLLFLWLCVFSTYAEERTASKIRGVYDGDTFYVDLSHPYQDFYKNVPIRVRNIDTPEIKGKCNQEIVQAKKAKRYVRRVLFSARNVVFKRLEVDIYNRLLAEVLVDGQRLDLMLVSAKLGRAYFGGKRESWC